MPLYSASCKCIASSRLCMPVLHMLPRRESFRFRAVLVSCRLIQSLKSHPNTKDFLYLQRFNRNPSEYNPYALRVEAFAKIDPNDFYTLSVNGITYYRNKVSEGFTELVQWERELMLFKQLKKLPLWRFFRVWKVRLHSH